jgi:hypothetical protein
MIRAVFPRITVPLSTTADIADRHAAVTAHLLANIAGPNTGAGLSCLKWARHS